MDSTLFLSQVVGPVLLLRGVSILVSRRHFVEMLDRLEDESRSVSFSMVPIALLMAGIALALLHRDTSSVAAVLFHIIAWGLIIKSSLLILFPGAVARKARLLGRAGFVSVVCATCLVVGAYLSWFGYFHGPVD
jgi:hypothetical protein